MRITEFSAHNYKSLRAVTFRPRAFNILVGPNDSGKSNLADCFSFLSDVYRNGLRAAVTRKGGFDNIAHRGMGPSKARVGVSVTVETALPRRVRVLVPERAARLRFHHSFSFRAHGSGLREDVWVDREDFSLSFVVPGETRNVVTIRRRSSQFEAEVSEEYKKLAYALEDVPILKQFVTSLGDLVPHVEVMALLVARFVPTGKRFVDYISRVRVYQFAPLSVRLPAAPTSKPELDRTGENLPAVVDSLQKNAPEAWEAILQTMRRINPRLGAITVNDAASRFLGLYFSEEGLDRPWSFSEVSDGTIQALALLVAIFEPRSSVLILEEPENSVHPWIVRNIVEACRSVSRRKQIVLTTHSPVLIDAAKPGEVWLMWREVAGSRVAPLNELEPGLDMGWKRGDLAISQLLDTGLLEPYVPAGVRATGPNDLAEEEG